MSAPSTPDNPWQVGPLLDEDEPIIPAADPPKEAFEYLTKADLIAAIAALKAAASETPQAPIYVIPQGVTDALLAQGYKMNSDGTALLPPDDFDEAGIDPEADPPPTQEPLFILPPPATPSGWSLEWRWRPGEIDWTTGKPKTDLTWSPAGTYRDKKVALRRLRSERYGQGRRKQFRLRLTLFDYHGDIQWSGPPEVTAAAAPPQSAEPPVSDFTSTTTKISTLPLKK